MTHRGHLWLLAIVLGGTSVTGFCGSGVTWEKTFLRNHTDIEVIVAQAPLFSNNPIIGQKLRYFNMYHTAIVFVQRHLFGRRYFTLEFDAQQEPANASLPEIKDGKLHWHSDARYCLTVDSEPLWGRSHWTKTWSKAAVLTVDQVDRIFNEVVIPSNGTGPGTGPQYQLWRMAPTVADNSVQDLSCGDGVAWILHFIASTLKKAPLKAMKNFRITSVIPRSYQLTSMPANDPEMVEYYRQQIALIKGVDAEGNQITLFRRFVAFFHAAPMRYVHDANSGAYYKVSWGPFGVLDALPFFAKFRFDPRALSGPPSEGLLV